MGKYYVTAASLHKNCILLKSRLLNCSIQRKKTCFFPFFFPNGVGFWNGIWNGGLRLKKCLGFQRSLVSSLRVISESVAHILPWCDALAQSKYLPQHDSASKVLCMRCCIIWDLQMTYHPGTLWPRLSLYTCQMTNRHIGTRQCLQSMKSWEMQQSWCPNSQPQ